jgi:response regulator of citrate/malate metabolism
MTAADLTVVVVDDDFMVAGIHTRFVDSTDGFRVIGTAATGATALAEIARLAPDLVLLDVHLPDLSGIEVLRRLRADGNDVGVIMVTAAREAETVRAAAAGGAAHYLVKPFGYDDLRGRLEAFRTAHLALAGSDTAAQSDIDTLFGAGPTTARGAVLPKGLSEPTAVAVLETLADAIELSAAECAEKLGLSRVTARRYLEHFVGQGRATVRLRYGSGRPERLYSVRRPGSN